MFKQCEFVASSRTDLAALPEEVRRVFGQSIRDVQFGDTPENAKPLKVKGFGGASVLELSEDSDHSTYRAVYTVRFALAVYVLHVFQKKSKSGITTPKKDVDLIKSRLGLAEAHYLKIYGGK